MTNAEGLKSLQNIGKTIWANKLTSAKGLENLRSIGGYAHFTSLSSTKYLASLETINGEDTTKFEEEINGKNSKTI